MKSGVIPSFRVQYFGNSPSTLNIAIRGNAPTDVGQITRAQGLGVDMADLEQIEVLRGPQGTLYGKNATGGAVNLISKKPTGDFGIKQHLTRGRFNEFNSATHLNLPALAGISAKIDYIHSERDGWVENTAPGQSDYNEYDKDSARLSFHWHPNELLTLDYAYDYMNTETAQSYFQLYQDNIGLITVEQGRQRKSRFDISPLNPTATKQKGNTLTVSWDLSDRLMIKSLTGYREIDETAKNNQQNIFTLDSFGVINGIPNTLITPTTTHIAPTPGGGLSETEYLPQIVNVNSQSTALYGQATWTLDEKLSLTLGTRYTQDKKKGARNQNDFRQFDDSWNHVDALFAVNYTLTENTVTYLKWSTAYKAGGVSLRSTSFLPYKEEEVEAFELGLKYQGWENRMRFNLALFVTDYDNMQIDFANPSNITVVETINAEKTVAVDGIEIELTVAPIVNLLIGLNYTYLDGDMPAQPNPLATDGSQVQFEMTQTPNHAGSLTLDYTLANFDIGSLIVHMDITSTDHYAYLPVGDERFDAYNGDAKGALI